MVEPRMQCDECGRNFDKAHRVRKGHRYCATCYSRVFKRRMCPRCGNMARLPKDDPSAVCRKCETDEPCARCGKTVYKIGKVTPYGPVCNACAPHFRQPEPCEACGRISTKLSKSKRLGGELRLCQKCARADHGTCEACRRHRQLFETEDGKKLCKACLEKDDVPCQSCGSSMPAGRGQICEACYWTETCRKRIQLDQAAFSVAKMSNAFGEFGEWLIQEVGPHKAALTIHRYLQFFLEMEKKWRRVPTYSDLLGRFSAEGLRRVRLPMRWLRDAKFIEPDPLLREMDSEQRRIKALLAELPVSTAAVRSLIKYKNCLMARVGSGDISLKTVRLSLRPAVSLLQTADSKGCKLPDQTELDQYLLEAPGQKAAITGFVNFLNKDHGIELVPNVDLKRVAERRKKALEKEIMILAKGGCEDPKSLHRWMRVAMELFHSKKVNRKVLQKAQIRKENGQLQVILGKTTYWLPEC